MTTREAFYNFVTGLVILGLIALLIHEYGNGFECKPKRDVNTITSMPLCGNITCLIQRIERPRI